MDANEGRFKLRDLLSVPMQRVLKYHLFLKVCCHVFLSSQLLTFYIVTLGALKMPELTMPDLTMMDQIAGVSNARPDNVGPIIGSIHPTSNDVICYV